MSEPLDVHTGPGWRALAKASEHELYGIVWRQEFEDGYGTGDLKGARAPMVTVNEEGTISLHCVGGSRMRPDIAEWLASVLPAAAAHAREVAS